MSKISVIIPAYNAEKYIGEAIDSVLAQTCPVHEIIVVDDGSTDRTVEIVSKKQGQSHSTLKGRVGTVPIFPIIRYFYQENRGPAAARNRGIKESTGDYIAFLDSDDTWLPGKIEKQIKIFSDKPHVGLVCTGRIRLGDHFETNLVMKKSGAESTEYSYLDLWKNSNFIATSTAMVRKDRFSLSGSFDEAKEISGTEDWDMWLRIAERSGIVCIREPLINYRVRKDGYCRSDVKRAFESSACAIIKNQNTLASRFSNHAVIIKNVWFKYHFSYGTVLFCSDMKDQARVQFEMALGYSPFNPEAWIGLIKTYLSDGMIRKIRAVKKGCL